MQKETSKGNVIGRGSVETSAVGPNTRPRRVKSVTGMPPKQTPYFLFCNEARESAREEFAKQGVPTPTGAA
eukprot:5257994-Pyramimonas_sp.AAC.1